MASKKDGKKLPSGMVERPGREGYYCDFQVNGNRIRDFLSTDFKNACQILNQKKVEADRDAAGMVDNSLPLKKLQESYLEHCAQALKPKTVKDYTSWLKDILPEMGVLRVNQLAIPAVLVYRKKRLASGKSPRTINAKVGIFSTMLNYGVEFRLIRSNPLAGLEPLPHDNPKEGRALDVEEVKALLDRSPAAWRDIWYALLVTGMRLNEVGQLLFTDIDWQARELVVRPTVAKNHKPRRIPMDDRLYEMILERWEKRNERSPGKARNPKDQAAVEARFTREHVFVTSKNTPYTNRGFIYRAFIRCCEQAGIEYQTTNDAGDLIDHVDVHSLRRTFATDLISNGTDPKTVQELLGHSSLAMTMKIYAKIRGGTRRQAMARLSYGQGASAPDHIIDMAGNGPAGRRQNVTKPEKKAEGQ